MMTIHATDGFALAMAAIFLLSFGMVALLVLGIYRSGKRRESEAESLIEELRREEDEEKHPASPSGAEEREPWEKEADWWKK